jgi:hypothetical protein
LVFHEFCDYFVVIDAPNKTYQLSRLMKTPVETKTFINSSSKFFHSCWLLLKAKTKRALIHEFYPPLALSCSKNLIIPEVKYNATQKLDFLKSLQKL